MTNGSLSIDDIAKLIGKFVLEREVLVETYTQQINQLQATIDQLKADTNGAVQEVHGAKNIQRSSAARPT